MQIAIQDRIIDVRFQYDEVALFKDNKGKIIAAPLEDLEYGYMDDTMQTTTMQTTCILSDVDPTKTGAARFSEFQRAEAVCSLKDRFSKVVGRKLALLRALQLMGLTKIQRIAVWNIFFKEINGGVDWETFRDNVKDPTLLPIDVQSSDVL